MSLPIELQKKADEVARKFKHLNNQLYWQAIREVAHEICPPPQPQMVNGLLMPEFRPASLAAIYG
jgi:hypothetical protein